MASEAFFVAEVYEYRNKIQKAWLRGLKLSRTVDIHNNNNNKINTLTNYNDASPYSLVGVS